ncbi:MAG: hypothetical protein IJA60_00155 [Clostridia bacterium]|nr:hypothetical protein [Clostridia bacterium]
MKKLLITYLALCVVLSACGNTPVETTEPVVTTTEKVVTVPFATTAPEETTTEEIETTEITTEVTVPSVVPEGEEYTIIRQNPKFGDNVVVEYDVLALGDTDIDGLIIAEAEIALSSCIPNISSVSIDGGSADYYSEAESVYVGDGIISAVFKGEYAVSYKGAASESRGIAFYTVNIDKESGKILHGKDIVSDFAKLSDAFAAGKFTAQGDEPYASDLSQYRTDYDIYPYLSFDEDNLYLYIFESGVNEFYTTYSISLEDASEFLVDNSEAVETTAITEETEG